VIILATHINIGSTHAVQKEMRIAAGWIQESASCWSNYSNLHYHRHTGSKSACGLQSSGRFSSALNRRQR